MRRTVLGAVLSAVLPAAAWGQVRLGPEFQVDTATADHQITPSVATAADGDFVVVWTTLDPYNAAVFGRRYEATGAPKDAAPFQVNTYTSGYAAFGAVAAEAGGQFVVAWRGARPDDLGEYDVMARIFSPSGTPVMEVQVNQSTFSSHGRPSVASDAIGNFVVAWVPYTAGNTDIAGRRFDAFGTPRGSQFQANSTTTGYQAEAAVSVDAFGNFVVVWAGPEPGGSAGIFGQRYDATGVRQGVEFAINSASAGDQGAPRVASDAGGRFVVVWSGPDGSGSGIFARRYDAAGVAQGPEFRVNTFTTDQQLVPAVTADGSGFVVTWTSFGEDKSSYGVVARRYDAEGVAEGDPFVVNAFTTNRQIASSIASTPNGGFVVAWSSLLQDGSGYGVFAQRFARDLLFRDGFE